MLVEGTHTVILNIVIFLSFGMHVCMGLLSVCSSSFCRFNLRHVIVCCYHPASPLLSWQCGDLLYLHYACLDARACHDARARFLHEKVFTHFNMFKYKFIYYIT